MHLSEYAHKKSNPMGLSQGNRKTMDPNGGGSTYVNIGGGGHGW